MTKTRHHGLQRLSAGVIVVLLVAACAAPEPVTQDPQATGGEQTPTEITGEQTPTEITGAQTPTEITGESEPGAGSEIPIGLLLPFTGEYAWVGANVQPVAEMILEEEVNADEALDGSIRLVQGDTEGVVDAGVAAARSLATVEQVLAFVGPTSLSFTGVRQVIEDTGIPMLSPTAGTTELDTAGEELFFRTVPSDSLGGRAIGRAVADAELLDRDSAFERPALMVGEAPALVSFAEPIKSSIAEEGLELAADMSFSTGKQSYRSEVGQVLQTDPDVIILVSEPEGSAQIMREAFEAGYEGTWFVTQDQTNAEYIALATPELVEGIYGLVEAPFEDAGARVDEFSQRLEEFSGKPPDTFALNTYDAINVIGLAILKLQLDGAEVTREALPDAIEAVANAEGDDVAVTSYTEGSEALQAGDGIDYQGLVGPVDFDDFGNIVAPFAIQQVRDGAYTTVATISAEELATD
jgi:neutral amino acid transport system substrate-binding protein